LIFLFKVFLNFLQEVVGSENGSNVRVLCVSLISWVDVVVLFSADRAPFLECDHRVFEDLLGVGLNKAAIAVICNTTTVVTIGDYVLDGLPCNLALLVVGLLHAVSKATHIDGNKVLTNLVV